MSNRLVWGQVLVVGLALAFGMLFMRGALTQEIHTGTALLCDTEEQVREFIALDGDAEALQKINATANVCGVLQVMYETTEVVGQIQTPDGLADIVKIGVIGLNIGLGWVTSGEPMVQYTLVMVQGRDA